MGKFGEIFILTVLSPGANLYDDCRDIEYCYINSPLDHSQYFYYKNITCMHNWTSHVISFVIEYCCVIGGRDLR